MEFIVKKIDEITVITLPPGRLVVGNAEELKRDIEPYITGKHKVILDLSQVQFLDSSGFGAILYCMRHLTTRGGEMKLSGISPSVQALFELVRMHRIFDLYKTNQEAIAAFSSKN